MLHEPKVMYGVATITRAIVENFKPYQVQRNIEQQLDVYEGREDITNVLSAQQLKDKEEGKPFVPDQEKALRQAKHTLEWGIETRLKGAYSHYLEYNELECIRYILIALNTICCAIGWMKASAYLNHQNRVLIAMIDKEEDSSKSVSDA